MMLVHIGVLLVVAVLSIVFVVVVDGARLVNSNVSLVPAAVMHVAVIIIGSDYYSHCFLHCQQEQHSKHGFRWPVPI